MPVIELLAPAKNKEIAIAAINYGADAVYIGGPAFGARSAAGNSPADIEAVVRHAHIYGAKTYVTVNTLLLDDEIEAASRLINDVYAMGADAVIVQDTGLLTDDLPPIAVHASTQMHNNTLEKVRFLAQIGVKRAVLPREFSLAEIAAIHAAVPEIELEAFIHGALCVSYSGQCYMSYALGGRSANRGECAQPCRKQYSLYDEKGVLLAKDKYLLSLKDLSLADYLEQLMDAGVGSFKIEGRLKNISYVKNAVAYYRQRIDALLEHKPGFVKASSGRVHFDFTPSLNKTFNRQYTDYFIDGRKHDIAQFDTPKALGEELGRVKAHRGGLIQLDNAAETAPGDGLCWFENGGLKGANVNKVSAAGLELWNVTAIAPKTVLYRNYDHKFGKMLGNSATVRKIAVDVLTEWNGGAFSLAVTDEDGVCAEITTDDELEHAKNREQAGAGLRKALAKLGDTPFELRLFTHSGDMPFMPLSALNALRRELFAKLIDARLKAFKAQPQKLQLGAASYPYNNLNFSFNVVNKAAQAFYARHGAAVNEPGAETGLNLNGRALMTTKHCLRFCFGRCCTMGEGGAASWRLTDDKGREYELRFDCEHCVMEIIYAV